MPKRRNKKEPVVHSGREIEKKNSKLIKEDLPKEEDVSQVRFIEKRRDQPFHDQINRLDMNHLHRPTGLFDLSLMLTWAAQLTKKL